MSSSLLLVFLFTCLFVFPSHAADPHPSNANPLNDTFPMQKGFKEKKSFDLKDDKSPVELNGDQIEFLREQNKMIVTGNVVVTKGVVRLTCDRMEFSRETSDAIADGHVVLETPEGTIRGDHMVYNFEKMAGDFLGAKIMADPFYGAGESVAKLDDKHLQMKDGYLTTCDFDKPHFRLATSKIDVYPGDKMIARNIRLIVGKIPLAFIPRFSQNLDDRKPRVLYIPGYDKQWGAFLLQDWRLYFNDNVKGHLHLDYREKKAFAPGLDISYKIPQAGEGITRLYYMNELTPQRKRFWTRKTGETIYRERFRAEWRHKWAVDERTEAVLQYSKLSDQTFLKDYFKREYEKDTNPQSFFLITRTLTRGTLSFRVDDRVNRFDSIVERLPEIRYDVSNQRLGSSNFYLKSTNTYSNLSLKDPSPSEIRRETNRVDSKNELSYPMKVGFVEFRPFVGQRETYYSKTKDPSKYDVVRSIFSTGADLSTKFYRVYDLNTNFWGMNINRLRHIVTPSIAYLYQHDPSLPATIFDTFDSSVEPLTRDHGISLGLENKFQTKRNGISVDLLRVLWSSTFNLKEHIGKGSFDQVKSDIEFRPTDWLRFDSDTIYDPHRELLSAANFDLYINDKDKWALGFGKRYNVDVDDQITTDFRIRLSPKWIFRIYDRYDIGGGGQKAQEFTLTRDLHEWEMDLNYNETRGEGSEIWVVFRLKAFPDMNLDLFGTSYNKRKSGSQGP